MKPFCGPTTLQASIGLNEPPTGRTVKKITIIQGHPDPDTRHFGHVLADAYAKGAVMGGHEIKRIEVAQLDFSLLRNQTGWNSGPPPVTLLEAQAAIGWADHLVIIFPLWLVTMPALL